MHGHGRNALETEDRAIRGTNDEATVGKYCAVSRGYYRDTFVDAFLSHEPQHFHGPLMNRGHFARVRAIQLLVERFLSPVPGLPNERQIVSLGCGFDTLFFRLASDHADLIGRLESFRFFETDFAQVVQRKRAILQGDARFSAHLRNYALFECDLRDTAALTARLGQQGFSSSAPTLFLSECVLIYMTPEEGSAIIEWASQAVPHSVFVTYEQIHPEDAFGKTMIRNLQARNIPLHSLLRFPTLEAQQRRYRDAGYTAARAMTMYDVYNNFLRADRRRVEALEVFDEYEEWQLVLTHYCLVVATRGSEELAAALAFAANV